MAQSEPVDLAQKVDLAHSAAQWMREVGVSKLAIEGEFTLELGPDPVPKAVTEAIQAELNRGVPPDELDELSDLMDRRGDDGNPDR